MEKETFLKANNELLLLIVATFHSWELDRIPHESSDTT